MKQGQDDVVAVGVTLIEGVVRGPNGETSVEFLVDSGAKFTLLPHEIWTAVGIMPKRRESFELADGSLIQRNMGECHVTFGFGDGHTPAILGEPGDDVAILGVITIEQFGLVLDPLRRSLKKARALLMTIS